MALVWSMEGIAIKPKTPNRLLKVISILSLLLTSVCSYAQAPLQCTEGPVIKFIGDGNWAAYSCSDKQTLVLYTMSDNPAAEFYFMFYIKDGKYKLYGEGVGDKNKTDKVHAILSRYNDKQIKDLIVQTRKIGKAHK